MVNEYTTYYLNEITVPPTILFIYIYVVYKKIKITGSSTRPEKIQKNITPFSADIPKKYFSLLFFSSVYVQ